MEPAVGIIGFFSGSLAWLALVLAKPLAPRLKLLDIPNDRKVHGANVPLIGGISVFVGLLLTWLAIMPLSEGYGAYLLCSFLLVTLGAMDDALDLPANFRLGAQVLLGVVLIAGSGLWLNSFGNLLAFGEIGLGLLGPLITIAALIGAINAFNMIDGIDGLAGSLSLVALCSLAVLFSAGQGFDKELMLAVGIGVALVPYLMANLGVRPFSGRIFMGDAGSMFIGFSLVWLLIKGTQSGDMAFRPVTALWIVGLPLIDMVAIMVRRYRKGQSVMKPDREHLHHIFLRIGFSDRQALIVISLAALAMAGIGLLGEWWQVPEWIMFAGFMALFFSYDRAMSNVWRLLVLFRRRVSED